MRKELIDLLHFLKSGRVVNYGTVNTCSNIDNEIMKEYADTIEKILSNEIILVDKNKLENKFEEQPFELKEGFVIVEKNFFLRSQLQLPDFDYKNIDKKDFQDYINKMLTNKLLDYFISEVGVENR